MEGKKNVFSPIEMGLFSSGGGTFWQVVLKGDSGEEDEFWSMSIF